MASVYAGHCFSVYMTEEDDPLIAEMRALIKKQRYTFSQFATLALAEKVEREKQKEKILAGEAAALQK